MTCKNMWIARMDQTPYGPIPRYVPCGRCDDCIRSKRREWAYRCSAESRRATLTIFLTLTYEQTDNVERYEYVQKFFKKLRKRGRIFRYFGCTEFGDTFGRLHHHILLFFSDKFVDTWLDLRPQLVKQIQDCWQHGFVHVLLANVKTINYVTGYIDKKLLDKERRVHNFMSLRDPIGWSYAKIGLDFLRSNGYDVFDGQKVSIPRAFKKRAEIQQTTRDVYERFKEEERVRLETEQRRGKTSWDIDYEEFRVGREVQRRNEARRGVKGRRVCEIMRKFSQFSSSGADGSVVVKEGEK